MVIIRQNKTKTSWVNGTGVREPGIDVFSQLIAFWKYWMSPVYKGSRLILP